MVRRARIQKIHAVPGTVRKICIVQRKFLLQRPRHSDATVFHAVPLISVPLLKITCRKHSAKISLVCHNHILVLRFHDIHNKKLRFRHGMLHIEQIQNLTVDIIPVFPGYFLLFPHDRDLYVIGQLQLCEQFFQYFPGQPVSGKRFKKRIPVFLPVYSKGEFLFYFRKLHPVFGQFFLLA